MKRIATFLTLLFFAGTANADWMDDFSGGAPQQSWIFGALPETGNYTTSYSSDFGGYLQIENIQAVPTGAAAVFGFVNDPFVGPGVNVQGVVNPNGAVLRRDLGIMANANPLLGSAYTLTIDYVSGDFDLTKIANNEVVTNVNTSITGFSGSNSYLLDLTWFNGTLTGRLYDTSDNLLHSLTFDDNDFTMGVAGVVVQRDFPGDPILRATWGSVSAMAIPEPSSIWALGALTLLATGYRRRK